MITKQQKPIANTAVSDEEIQKVEDYLRGYSFHQKMLDARSYEEEFFYPKEDRSDTRGDFCVARVKMFEIRHFIMGLENCDEKLLLYFHYVKGESIERCGEMLGVSRCTAFRIKKRALCFAAIHKKSQGLIDGI